MKTTINLDPLKNEPRLLIEAKLKPIAGTRFQPDEVVGVERHGNRPLVHMNIRYRIYILAVNGCSKIRYSVTTRPPIRWS